MNDPSITSIPQTEQSSIGDQPLISSSIPPGRLYGLMAEFETPGAILEAAQQVRDAGYKWWDCHTPFAVHGLDKAMGIKPTILPLLVFCCGITGTTMGFLLQNFTNAWDISIWAGVAVQGYPFFISGKPAMGSLPAFIPVIFEMTVLFSAVGTFALMFLMNGLPRWYHPCFKADKFARASDDRFFLVIEARDPRFYRAKTEQLMLSLNPLSLEALEA